MWIWLPGFKYIYQSIDMDTFTQSIYTKYLYKVFIQSIYTEYLYNVLYT